MPTRDPGSRPALGAMLAAIALLPLGDARAGEPPLELLADAIPALLELYSKLGDFHLPDLSPAETNALLAGESFVTVFDDPGSGRANDAGAMRVAGMQVVDAPRLLVWVSLLGERDELSGKVKRTLLANKPAGAYVTYQHMDLPWPFKNRQWVILSEKNLALADESADRIWEHRWSLVPRGEDVLETAHAAGRISGVTRQQIDDSVYLAANRGAWILFDLGHERTLVAAYLDVDLGGQFPAALVRSFTKRQLKSELKALKALSGADSTYNEQPMVHDGHGLPISRWTVLEASGPWLAQSHVVRTSATVDASQ
jgi:hypothetical protein